MCLDLNELVSFFATQKVASMMSSKITLLDYKWICMPDDFPVLIPCKDLFIAKTYNNRTKLFSIIAKF
jgi:hypothetical protein